MKSILGVFEGLMKSFALLFVAVMVWLVGSMAYAQAVGGDVVSNESFFKAVFDLVVGYKGLTGAAGTVAVVQMLIMFLKTDLFDKVFKKVTGATKLLIMSVLTLLVGIFSLKASGMSTAQAFSDASNLVALQVLVHQLINQFFVKKD